MTAGPRDIVIRVPQDRYLGWLAEGDLPGDEPTEDWCFFVGATTLAPPAPDTRCYVVAFGVVRGYAPLLGIGETETRTTFIRRGGAVACTVWPENMIEDLRGGRWSWRYRCWEREHEVPFDGRWGRWAFAMNGLPERLEKEVFVLMTLRRDLEKRATLKERALAGMTKAQDLFAGLT